MPELLQLLEVEPATKKGHEYAAGSGPAVYRDRRKVQDLPRTKLESETNTDFEK